MSRLVRSALLACLTLAFGLVAGAAAAAPPPVLDRELFFGNPEISGAQLSPDGQYVAFLKPWSDTRNIWVKKTSEPFEAARRVTAETKRPISGFFFTRDSRLILYVKDNDGDENFNVWAVDPAAAKAEGKDVPPSRNLTDAKGARAFIYDVPKKSPDTIYVGLNDRDAAWHDVYRVSISTGKRELVRKNTDRIAGWVFDLEGQLRMAVRTTDKGDTEVLKVLPEGFKTVYTCSVFETCGPDRFHKDGKRVYMQTNKGDVDLSRLVLFDPETGKEELVESDPMNRVDFGGRHLLRGHRRARREPPTRTTARGSTSATRPGRRTTSCSRASSRARTSASARRPRTTASLLVDRLERRRPRRALPVRPRDQEADPAVQGPRADPARAHGGDEGRSATRPRTASRSRPSSRCRRASPRRACPRSWCRTAAPGLATAGASTTSRSSWPTAATRSCSPTSAPRPATARSTSTPATSSGATRCRTTSPGASSTSSPRASPTRSASGSWAAPTAGTRPSPGSPSLPTSTRPAVSIVGPSNLITLLDSIPPYWEAGRIIFHERMGNPTTPEGKAQLVRAVAAQLRAEDQDPAPRGAGRQRPARQEGRVGADRDRAARPRLPGRVHPRPGRGPRLPAPGQQHGAVGGQRGVLREAPRRPPPGGRDAGGLRPAEGDHRRPEDRRALEGGGRGGSRRAEGRRPRSTPAARATRGRSRPAGRRSRCRSRRRSRTRAGPGWSPAPRRCRWATRSTSRRSTRRPSSPASARSSRARP